MIDDGEIVDGIDVDHLDDRPDELAHVAIEETADGRLKARPFRESERPPGYVEIDVDLMKWDEVCRYVETVTDYNRRIDFTRVPTWRPDEPTPADSPGRW